jgi:hypothetical protein
MKAIHIQVPGLTLGSLALQFSNWQEMGQFAKAMLSHAKAKQNIICYNSPGQTQEQMDWNTKMAGYEAKFTQPFSVSIIKAPLVSDRKLVAMTEAMYLSQRGVILATSDKTEEKTPVTAAQKPGFNVKAASGKAHARAGVVQPWTKQGITENDWRAQNGWDRNENPAADRLTVVKTEET